MLLPWPLTTSTELAQVLRPGAHLRADSALRTLRGNGLAAEPISVVPRSKRGAHGRVVWYSSLMIDVVRLFRVDDLETAGVLATQAGELASGRAARFVAEQLLGDEEGPDAAVVDAATGGALTRLGLLTASIRHDHHIVDHLNSFVGKVVDCSARGAVVIADDGREVVIPGNSCHAVDDIVAVDTEILAGGTTIWVRRGFETESDPHGSIADGARLLTSAERERIGHQLTSAR